MRKLALALLATVFSVPAFAADLPVKAKSFLPTITCTLASCSGWYVGVDLSGIGSNADIIGQGLSNSVFAGGGMIGASGGYQFWNGTYFAAFEVGCSYDASTIATLAASQRYFCNQTVKLGGALSNILSLSQPTPSQGGQAVGVPSSLANALLAPYVLVGAAERSWGTGWDTGAGAQFVIASGWNLKLEYHYINYGQGAVVPTGAGLVATSKSENIVRLGLQAMF